MSDFKNSQTAINLIKAFVGESQARNRYTFYAKIARQEDLCQVESTFREIADNEVDHASVFYNKLIKYGFNNDSIVLKEVKFNISLFETTLENLKFSANGERTEYMETYPEFARIAEKEGYHDISDAFRLIANVEEEHEKMFLKHIGQMQEKSIFSKDGKLYCKCSNCGFLNENI